MRSSNEWSCTDLSRSQDNYPKQNFSRANNLDGHEAALKKLELMDKAAEAISQGDCIDRMIHG